jgi:hypothetical protein
VQKIFPARQMGHSREGGNLLARRRDDCIILRHKGLIQSSQLSLGRFPPSRE